jgi:glucoamylase
VRRTFVGGLRPQLAWFCAVVIAVLAVLRWGGAYSPVPAWSIHDATARYTPGQLEQMRRWLEMGTVPGATTRWADMTEQALLDLRSLTRPSGATVASNYGPWRHVWPRDASWVAAAFCVSGHPREASQVLSFLAHTQRDDGRWEARYRLDGQPLRDRRGSQLDANGWALWAVGLCARSLAAKPLGAATGTPRNGTAVAAPDGDGPAAALAVQVWPLVQLAADAAARALGHDGLPPKSPDYWETRSEVTLGTAAPLLAGLRSAADLARQNDHLAEAGRWTAAADRLATAIRATFGTTGYLRRPGADSGADAAVTFLARPFGSADPGVDAAVRHAAARLAVPNGGMRPGERWNGDPHEAWTPETALFALAFAASGDHEEAGRLLDWLDRHRSRTGSLPERVSKFDDPVSVAPLGWTAAITVLAVAAYDGQLP